MFCFVLFFLSYLDSLIEQSIIFFFWAYSFLLLLQPVCVFGCMCVGVIPQNFVFPFLCVKNFFYTFSRVNHCLLYEYFNELYTV